MAYQQCRCAVSKKNKKLAVCFLVFVAGQFAGAVVYYAQTLGKTLFTESESTVTAARWTAAVTAFVDMALALALLILIHGRKSAFSHSNSVIDRVMAYTVGTGLITGECKESFS